MSGSATNKPLYPERFGKIMFKYKNGLPVKPHSADEKAALKKVVRKTTVLPSDRERLDAARDKRARRELKNLSRI